MTRCGRWIGPCVALFVTAGAVAAEELTAGIRDMSTIANARGESRILFRVPDLGLPDNALILRATLEFTVDTVPLALEEQIQVHPVTTAWTAEAVSWTTGWQTAGGDIEPDFYSHVDVDLSRGRHTIGVDLTGLLKEQLEEGLFTDGFLMTVPPYIGEGIPAASAARYLSVGTATLRVSYREVSAPVRTTRSG